jgi:pimeloyl-ACP methyl ester carboxylesterase
MLHAPASSNNAEMAPTQYLSVNPNNSGEYQLAYIHSPGNSPGVVFLPGFMSTMRSTKPRAIFNYCQEHDLEFTTFDYSCHGESSCSNPQESSISRWMQEALWILEETTTSPRQIIVGSSMGAWIMVLLAQSKRTNRTSSPNIVGLVGIASAPDFAVSFSETIYSNSDLTRQMEDLGYSDLPTEYDESGYYRIYANFLKDADETKKLFTNCSIDIGNIPVNLLHGKEDIDVDSSQSEALFSKIASSDCKELVLIEGGDHRLSKPHELEIIRNSLDHVYQITTTKD